MEKILKEILEKVISMDSRLSNIEEGQKETRECLVKLEEGQTKIDKTLAKLDDFEAKNANRHIDLMDNISTVQNNLQMDILKASKNF
ncbi:hypothetical protein [Dethiothermospora halolimnae]|uniref:hypothetical protein n=1 Tax=Dethiothermospora halolimnae TaxID=3114390 RepID=UPI003CCBA009